MKIGIKALSQLEENKQYYFDVSTTVCCLAEKLNKVIKVFTHSLDIVEVLSNQTESSVFLFGGNFYATNRFFFDADIVERLENVRFDGAFLGAAAFMGDGIYFENKEDAYMKQKVAKRSFKNVILADSHKFTIESYHKGLEWSDVDIIITNENPPEHFLNIIRNHHIQLLITE